MNSLGKVTVEEARTRTFGPNAVVAISAVDERIKSAGNVRQEVASLYITAAVLATIGFLYASLIPLVFEVPDYSTRILGAFEPSPWNASQLFDVIANVAAFVPLGFLWGAACNTAAPRERSRRGLFVTVVMGCLGLAVLAECLQIWIPLRDPSIRDVIALEWGAVLGYRMWLAAGPWTTGVLCLSIDWLYRVGGPRLFRLRWPVLFVALLVVSLIVNCYASPAQLFLLYRFRSTSLQDIAFALHNANVKRAHTPMHVLLPSAVSAVLIVGACRGAQFLVRFTCRASLATR